MKIGTDGILLGAWADVAGAKRILDIGSGTGLIALMLAQRNTDAQIHAVEIDEGAYLESEENFQAAPWTNRLKVFHASVQDLSTTNTAFYDLIVSNPPFFSGGVFSWRSAKNSARHTIKLSHGDLLVSVQRLLSPDGRFCLILPLIEGMRFVELAETYRLFCNRMTEVLPRKEKRVERLLLQFELEKKEMVKEELIIQKEKTNDWTKAFIQLCGDFSFFNLLHLPPRPLHQLLQ